MPEYVYVLSNAAMPGIVKVGFTKNVAQRIRYLSAHSGVPVPFDLELAAEVTDAKRVEDALHSVLQGSRVNPKREFFEADPEDLRIILTACGDDVTASVDPRQAVGGTDDELVVDDEKPQPIDEDDFAAGARLRRRRPPLDFDELGIERGTQLVFRREEPDGPSVRAEVIEPKHVRFRDERMSLTQATRLALRRDYGVAPLTHWRTEDGRLLQDIYDDHHGPPR